MHLFFFFPTSAPTDLLVFDKKKICTSSRLEQQNNDVQKEQNQHTDYKVAILLLHVRKELIFHSGGIEKNMRTE